MRISDWSSDVCSSDLANRARQRAIDDGECTRRTAEQDRLGQCAVDRGIEAGDVVCRRHQISAPPPKLKKLRKKLDAAKAMERPNTNWLSRRKPTDVSPKARLKRKSVA